MKNAPPLVQSVWKLEWRANKAEAEVQALKQVGCLSLLLMVISVAAFGSFFVCFFIVKELDTVKSERAKLQQLLATYNVESSDIGAAAGGVRLPKLKVLCFCFAMCCVLIVALCLFFLQREPLVLEADKFQELVKLDPTCSWTGIWPLIKEGPLLVKSLDRICQPSPVVSVRDEL